MSEHGSASIHSVEKKDYGVRPSAGISWMILVFITVSLIIIFWQGSNVVGSAKLGHVWPAGNSTKVELPASHL
jgi:hypothetical protein